MINVPKYYEEGIRAATNGVAMTAIEAPMGFTFCPYRDNSVERWNFIGGCVRAYMGAEEPLRGEYEI